MRLKKASISIHSIAFITLIAFTNIILAQSSSIPNSISNEQTDNQNSSTNSLTNSSKISIHLSPTTKKELVKAIIKAELPPEPDSIFGFQLSKELSILSRVLIFAYICLAIGYLCDEFFVPSLELIGRRLQWPNDLVASILIPFGTSGPEIFSSAIGIFFASNEIGTGAIIGSAVFNMLAIPAVCSVVAVSILGTMPLEKKPILRDLLFYVVSLICLTQAIRDGRIDLIDALSLLLVFVIYLTYMFYKSKFTQEEDRQREQEKREYQKAYGIGNCVSISIDDVNSQAPRETDISTRENGRTLSNAENANVNDNDYDDDDIDEGVSNSSHGSITLSTLSTLSDFVEEFISRIEPPKPAMKTKDGYEPLIKQGEESDNGFDLTQNPVLHILLLPFIVFFNLTMFNRQWAFVNFFFSIIWLSLLSYITVWAITGLSEQLAIPANIAGMTLLALGSAVPDLVTSIVVIKKTKAMSMSICAAIASNVFAILLGLGLPWATQIIINMSVAMDENVPGFIVVESGTLPTSCMLLLGTVVLFYFALRACDWKFSYVFSGLCALMFVAFIGINVFLEFSDYNTILAF